MPCGIVPNAAMPVDSCGKAGIEPIVKRKLPNGSFFEKFNQLYLAMSSFSLASDTPK